MIHARRYCRGCNAKFSIPIDQLQCPQCGQTLISVMDAPTADLDQVAAWGTHLDGLEPADEADDELIGKQLASTYAIDVFLGKGGMARVYRATHLTLERPCAIKVLSPKLLLRNADYLDQFFAEARAAAALVHPNVVGIHSLAHDAGLHLIEMEYVPGMSLQRMLQYEGSLDSIRATKLMMQICAALAAAHEIGIIHRDIKPANVMVSQSGIAKLSDFGLAKRVLSQTKTGSKESIAGTPYFMAPELFEGISSDKRSDVYAMGITFFELLTGDLPFVDTHVAQVSRKHAEEPLPDWETRYPLVPAAAAHVIDRCLAKHPGDRFADARELHTELQAVYANLRTLDNLVRESLSDVECSILGQDEEFQIRVPTADGRSQVVAISSCKSAATSDQIVKIYSVCGRADSRYYGRALELNAVLPHRAVAVESISGVPHFVMSNAYSRSTCGPEEVRSSVQNIAQHADEVERWLSAEDHH